MTEICCPPKNKTLDVRKVGWGGVPPPLKPCNHLYMHLYLKGVSPCQNVCISDTDKTEKWNPTERE